MITLGQRIDSGTVLFFSISLTREQGDEAWQVWLFSTATPVLHSSLRKLFDNENYRALQMLALQLVLGLCGFTQRLHPKLSPFGVRGNLVILRSGHCIEFF